MLFLPKRDKDIFKAYPELEAIPEFYELNDRQMKALIWYADYRSPFRQKPQKERFRLACLEAGYKPMVDRDITLESRAREIMDGKLEKWNVAYAKYMEMQHDDAREMVDLVDSQLENIRSMMKEPSTDEATLEKRNKLINSLPSLMETKRNLARLANMEELIMGIEESNADDGGKRKRSLIDEEISQMQKS